MYTRAATRRFPAGHAAADETALATRWFFAEGVTGDYFDTFLAILNRHATPLDVQGGVSAELRADAPFVAERSMWWPGAAPTWHEAHAIGGLAGRSSVLPFFRSSSLLTLSDPPPASAADVAA
jgi:hypothetical protein